MATLTDAQAQQLKAILLTWLFCVVNSNVLENIGDADYPKIAASTGLAQNLVGQAISKAKTLNKGDFSGMSPLEAAAQIFNPVAFVADYVSPAGGSACGSIGEIYQALSS